MKTAEIRACQPQGGLCKKGCRRLGATIGCPGLVRTGGQEFGRWVRFSCSSDQPPPLNCPLAVVGEGRGELGLQGSSINTLMGLREPGRNVGPTVPGDSRRDESRGDKSPGMQGGEKGSGKERKAMRRRTDKSGEDTTSHTEPRQFLSATLAPVPRSLQKLCPALWEKRQEGQFNFPTCDLLCDLRHGREPL